MIPISIHRDAIPLLTAFFNRSSLIRKKIETYTYSLLDNGPINLLSDRLLRYVLIFEYQILVLDLVVDIRTKISEGIHASHKKLFFFFKVQPIMEGVNLDIRLFKFIFLFEGTKTWYRL